MAAASTTNSISIRDDSSYKSLSINERIFLRASIIASSSTTSSSNSSSSRRGDGRHTSEMRSLQLTFGRTTMGRSECTVQLGLTRVLSVITCDLIPPPQGDIRPNDGMIRVNVILSPMSSSSLDDSTDPSAGGGGGGSGEGKVLANRIAQCIERIIVHGGSIDTESLCVVGGEWVWRLNVTITALDHDGNILDASVLAAVAALRHFRKPEVVMTYTTNTEAENGNEETNNDGDVDGEGEGGDAGVDGASAVVPKVISSDEREASPLPMHHTPVCISLALFTVSGSAVVVVVPIIDPSFREELIMDGIIHFAFNIHGELCMVDSNGGCELRVVQLVQCAKLARSKAVELCQQLEKALSEADGKANEERMYRLRTRKRQQRGESTSGDMGMMMIMMDGPSRNTPYVSMMKEGMEIADLINTDRTKDDTYEDKMNEEVEEEEEVYKRRALKYSQGHMAAKVKDVNDKMSSQKRKQIGIGSSSPGKARGKTGSSSLLFEAMIRSATHRDMDGICDANTAAQDANLPHSGASAVASCRTQEAIDEFDNLVKTTGGSQKGKYRKDITDYVATTMNLEENDVDDEEPTTTLQSEFATIAAVDVAPDDIDEVCPAATRQSASTSNGHNITASKVSSSPFNVKRRDEGAIMASSSAAIYNNCDSSISAGGGDRAGNGNDEDEIDDLAMAVISKSKKKGNAKKKAKKKV